MTKSEVAKIGSSVNTKKGNLPVLLVRIIAIVIAVASAIPGINPVRISGMLSDSAALITTVLSPNDLTETFNRALMREWIQQATITKIYVAALILTIAVVGIIVAACMSLGTLKFRSLASKIALASSVVGLLSLAIVYWAFTEIIYTTNFDRVQPMFPGGFWIFAALFALIAIFSVIGFIRLPKPGADDVYYMESKYKLFLMVLPFVVLTFLFSYLPLFGWRYAFFDYTPGAELTADNFVGFKWFTFLFNNPATRGDLVRVLRNTLAMSFIGVMTSWLPMLVAILLNEVRKSKFKKFVQTTTTIPNFISWVLVYVIIFAIFSTDGFLNTILMGLGVTDEPTNYLMSSNHIWLKMWAVGTWKSLGWNSIIYLSTIASIDQQLYEAADIDGAGRFQKMRYITLPGLMPTFTVLFLLSIGNILSNGMDQYLVFENAMNKDTIEVLDLYVYHLGLGSGGSGNIPLSTVIGMFKSVISIVLITVANQVAKKVRGESIL